MNSDEADLVSTAAVAVAVAVAVAAVAVAVTVTVAVAAVEVERSSEWGVFGVRELGRIEHKRSRDRHTCLSSSGVKEKADRR